MACWALKTAKMYRIVFLLFGSIMLLGCSLKSAEINNLPYYNEPDFTPIFISDISSVSGKISHTISDFSLLNQDSVRIDQSIISGKIHIANFIFTSCGMICPTMTQHMKRISDSTKQNPDVVILSYSVTPWIDQPHVLNRYKHKNGIDNNNWHFLTGPKSVIYNLARKSYFAEEDIGFSKDSTEFLHTEHCVLIDKTKRIRGIYNGTLAVDMKNLLDDIRMLTAEP
ncbi:SCO family protein [Nostoc sp. CHAB 5834]|nr:SCO family protein [Nostoc sp. CHAB 5834]